MSASALLEKLPSLALLACIALPVTARAAAADKLQDSFGATSINSTLWTVTQSRGTASESGGTLNLAPNANTGSATILVSSAATYSLAGSQTAVKVTRVPSSAGSVNTQFIVARDNSNYLEWYFESGFLYAFKWIGGIKTQLAKFTYSATTHAWWRIRESAGQVFWETSPDGAVYTVQAAVNTSSLFAISAMRVRFYAETFNSGLASPGQASFASLNIAPSGILPMSSLVDRLGGTSLGSSWRLAQQTQGVVSESGGSLNLTPNANTGTSQLIVESARPYALTGSAALVKAKQVVSGGGNVNNSLAVQIDVSNKLEWWFESGVLSAFYTVNGTRTLAVALTYDATQHAWWRIREAGGTVYWDTASDGVAWTSRASVPSASLFSLSMLLARFYAETFGAGSSAPGSAQYADFNYVRYFVVSGVPSSLTAGVPDSVTVEVRDAFANRATDFVGTVHFVASDPRATVPGNYTFTSADAGIKTFTSGLVFRTASVNRH